MEVCLAVIFSLPENKTSCWLRHFQTIDLEIPFSLVISWLLLTASASGYNFQLEVEIIRMTASVWHECAECRIRKIKFARWSRFATTREGRLNINAGMYWYVVSNCVTFFAFVFQCNWMCDIFELLFVCEILLLFNQGFCLYAWSLLLINCKIISIRNFFAFL